MVKVGVIGVGHWGPNLIRNLDNRRRSCVARVVDLEADRLERMSEYFPHIDTATEPASIFEDDSIDAVAIATPSTTHYDLTSRALSHGKHVLVEKPLACSSDQALELAGAAHEAGLILLVGHVYLYNSAIRFTKSILVGGLLGRPYYITMERTNLGPIRTDVNASWDLGSHDVAIANYLLDDQPLSVSAMGGSWVNPGIEDIVVATLRYPKDVLVHVHLSWLNPRKSRELTIVGDRRMMTLDDLNILEPVRLFNRSRPSSERGVDFVESFTSFQSLVREGNVVIPQVDFVEPLKAECEDFIRCIVTGDTPVSDPETGCAVVRVLEAIDRSLAGSGREEPVRD